MQLDRLIADATGGKPDQSRRARINRLVERLNAQRDPSTITPKGVEKWFERNTVPGGWLMRVAALRTPPLNLSDYA